jgi:pimeloyl-ACP methyl ester carboxylesterase
VGREETLRRIAVPALIVIGDQDALTTREDADEMRAVVRGSALLQLEGAGHTLNLERAEAFNAALERLFAATRSRLSCDCAMLDP